MAETSTNIVSTDKVPYIFEATVFVINGVAKP